MQFENGKKKKEPNKEKENQIGQALEPRSPKFTETHFRKQLKNPCLPQKKNFPDTKHINQTNPSNFFHKNT